MEEDSFQLRVEAPERVGAWEHVGIRVTALNKHVEEVTAHITLAHSDDYKFVALEDFDVTGVSASYLVQLTRWPRRALYRYTLNVSDALTWIRSNRGQRYNQIGNFCSLVYFN